MKRTTLLFSIIFTLLANLNSSAQVFLAGKNPGIASINIKKSDKLIQLKNKTLQADFTIINGTLAALDFKNKEQSSSKIDFKDQALFEFVLKDKSRIKSTTFKVQGEPIIKDISADPAAQKLADRFAGKSITLNLIEEKANISVKWTVSLRDNANYIRQNFSINSPNPVMAKRVILLNLPANPNIKETSRVDGSPLAGEQLFFAIEHPMSQIDSAAKNISCFLPRLEALNNGVLDVSVAWGVYPKDQERRAYLYYIERERAAPYHQLLHYNSWYDLSWSDRKMEEGSSLDRIQTYADSLITKRNTPMDAFLFDDGWDDNQSLWKFNKNFPQGFDNLAKLAAKYNAHLGVWMSPWGGYDEAKVQRLKYGMAQNPPFKTNENGFSLTGKSYYERFKAVTSEFVTKNGIKIFKFDGVGAGNGADGASLKYQADIEAFVKLIESLRKLDPKLYISMTVGTWPSPYWLKIGDNIWRAGDDTGLDGEGTVRQKLINYRDAQIHKNIVVRAPLYPLNALMSHGICIANNGIPGTVKNNDKEIADEIWSFFGSGTSLQELYVNPHLLNSNNWDQLAKAIAWSRKNATVLADVHWVGGNPAKQEVYGFASWNPQKATLSLRNPSDQTQTFKVNVRDVLQIPTKFKSNYIFKDAKENGDKVANGEEFTITLAPFEVKVMDGYLTK
ncbi:hypothetical protein I5M32_11875 [Pedobacter sp. SD-b]|uniref:Enterotoxin n=1 Tax=Pedobacter segetis TaxID=2793069 RepID=A0ABS1BL84_9SPHI|nr:hypothetical protein [Pedobacter segetis]MBK0383657.1 hypothetical protein [Pedobacter segetis]